MTARSPASDPRRKTNSETRRRREARLIWINSLLIIRQWFMRAVDRTEEFIRWDYDQPSVLSLIKIWISIELTSSLLSLCPSQPSVPMRIHQSCQFTATSTTRSRSAWIFLKETTICSSWTGNFYNWSIHSIAIRRIWVTFSSRWVYFFFGFERDSQRVAKWSKWINNSFFVCVPFTDILHN